MAIPTLNLNIADGGLGSIPADATGIQVKVGACSKGPLNEIRSFGTTEALIETFGSGPLVEAAAHVLAVAGGPVHCVRVPASPGYVAPETDDESVSFSGDPADAYELLVRIRRSGGLGVGEFSISLDGGRSSLPTMKLPENGEYVLEGHGLTALFADREYSSGESFSFACVPPSYGVSEAEAALGVILSDSRSWGWVHFVGNEHPNVSAMTKEDSPGVVISGRPSGFHRVGMKIISTDAVVKEVSTENAPPPVVSVRGGGVGGRPTEALDLLVEITESGGRGSGKFRWSKDGGATWVENATISANGILDTQMGILVVFPDAGYRSGDTFRASFQSIIEVEAVNGAPEASATPNGTVVDGLIEITHAGERGSARFRWTDEEGEWKSPSHKFTIEVEDGSSGAFTLEVDGQEIGPFDHDAEASEIQSALEALPSVGAGGVTCTGGPLGTEKVTVEFTGQAAGRFFRVRLGEEELEGRDVSLFTLTEGGEVVPTIGDFPMGGITFHFPNSSFEPGHGWEFESDVYPTSGKPNDEDGLDLVGLSGEAPTPEVAGVGSGRIIIRVSSSGALGVVSLQSSFDGGKTFSSPKIVPASGEFEILPGLSGKLADSSYRVGDSWDLEISAPIFHCSLDDASPVAVEFAPEKPVRLPVPGLSVTFPEGVSAGDEFEFLTFEESVANARSMAEMVAASMSHARAEHGRYAFGVIEAPQAPDNALLEAFDSFVDPEARVSVCAGDVLLASSVQTSRSHRRNVAWPATARAASVPLQEDLAWVGRGSLPGVREAMRDERVTPSLDEGRFTTARTHVGRTGVYLTNARLMCAAGSDFRYLQHRRVMDRACEVGDSVLLGFLNQDLAVDPETGRIAEVDAVNVEVTVRQAVNDALRGAVSSVEVQVDREENILATEKLKAKLFVVPFAYAKTIEATIGFRNPAAE